LITALVFLGILSFLSSQTVIWNILWWRFDHAGCPNSLPPSPLFCSAARALVLGVIALGSDGLIVHLALFLVRG
jgi:hypothetical protein